MSRRSTPEDLYNTVVLPARLAQPLAVLTIECPRERAHQHERAALAALCHPSRVHGLLAEYREGCAVIVHQDSIDVAIGPGPTALDPAGRAWLDRLLADWGSRQPTFSPPGTISLANIPPGELQLVYAQLTALIRGHLVRPTTSPATPITVGLLR